MFHLFQTFIKCHCQLFISRFKMVDQCDKPGTLRKFVFDEENHEQKSWKLFGCTCSRSLLVFLCQFLVIVLMQVCASIRSMLSTTGEEATVKYSRLYSDFFYR